MSVIGKIAVGEFYLNAGMDEKASESLFTAEKIILETGMDDYWLAMICKDRAQILKHKGNLDQARKNMEKAFQIFLECGCDRWANQCTDELSGLV